MDKPRTRPNRLASDRAQQYEVARLGVQEKIFRVYGLDETMLATTVARRQQIADNLDYFSSAKQWQKKCMRVFAEQRIDMTPESQTKFDRVASRGLFDYLQGYRLRALVKQQPVAKTYPATYRSSYVRERLLNLYLNHVTNRIEEEFTALGVSPKAAHQLNGTVILSSLGACNGIDGYSSGIVPALGSTNGLTDGDAAWRIRLLRRVQPDQWREDLSNKILGPQR